MTQTTRTPATRRSDRDGTLRDRILARGQRKCQRAFGYASAALAGGPIASMCIINDRMPLTPELMLMGYSQGLFPMDYSGTLRWQSPDPRSVLLLADLRISARMRALMRKATFDIHFDTDLEGVLQGCADRDETWLTPRMLDVYRGLGELGAVRTTEAWHGGRMVAGTFGVPMGRVFIGESSFTRMDNASKIAWVHTAEHLRAQGFDAIDCQYHKSHFARFGAVEMPRDEYRRLLARGMVAPADYGQPSQVRAVAG